MAETKSRTYYAWTRIPTDVDEYGKPGKMINPGDEVSKSKLDIADEEWDYLVESRAVRTTRYPDLEEGQSPAEYYREQLAEIASGLHGDATEKEIALVTQGAEEDDIEKRKGEMHAGEGEGATK
jgi:hypothetical protein